jgi:uncharacterized protein (TIGR04255 family)
MGKKLANAPIFYTVGQIRFNPVLNLAEYVPKIHERLRREFPDVREDQVMRVQMNFAAAEKKDAVTSVAKPRWFFTDLKNTSGYVLQTDSIVFHTTAYETSHEFSAAMIKGLRIIDEIVGLTFVDAVSVRTLDAVIPDAEKPLDFYISSQVLGFHNLLEGEVKHNISENVTIQKTGRQVSRVVVLHGTIGIPIDLFPIPLKVSTKFQQLDGLHAILDLDHIQEERFEFDLEEVEARIRQVKQGVNEVFHKVVTAEAVKAWDKN